MHKNILIKEDVYNELLSLVIEKENELLKQKKPKKVSFNQMIAELIDFYRKNKSRKN